MTGHKAKPVVQGQQQADPLQQQADPLAKIKSGPAKTELLRLRDVAEKEQTTLRKLRAERDAMAVIH
jgi:hypothetical protein